MTNKDRKERLTDTINLLSIPGVGRERFQKLVKRFGSPEGVLGAPISELAAVPGISRKTASAVRNEQNRQEAAELASRIIQLGWKVTYRDDPDYPESLAKINSAPPVMFSDGQPLNSQENAIAIVGTRHATERGRLFAYNLAADLARAGIVVVSGMADGIDSAAHRGALESGGRTIAVWGTSLDIVYPPENRQLAEQIKASGTVCSEYFPGSRPDRSSFPERNRIISGLSAGVVVVEAGKKSGALLTAAHAVDQSRELFAVPGAPDFSGAFGTNSLIKQGARLLTKVDDIFDELPRLRSRVAVKSFTRMPDLTDTERKIIALFSDGPIQLDNISRSVELPVSETIEFMLALELKGIVRELSGKRFVLTEDYS